MSFFLRNRNLIRASEAIAFKKADVSPEVTSIDQALEEAGRRAHAENSNRRSAGLRPYTPDEHYAATRKHYNAIVRDAKVTWDGALHKAAGGGVQPGFSDRRGLLTLPSSSQPQLAPKRAAARDDSEGKDEGNNPATNSDAGGPRDDGQGKSEGGNPARNSTAGGRRDDGNGRDEVENPAARPLSFKLGRGIKPSKKTRLRKSGGDHPLDRGVLDLSRLFLPAAR